MDKYFICLANSYKHGGRCVAGVEVLWDGVKCKVVREDNGAPRWIRPICKDTHTGEIPNHVAQLINVLDVVKLEGVELCPCAAQNENVYYEKLSYAGKHYDASPELLKRFMDENHRHVFYNYGKAIKPDAYLQGTYSILMIRTDRSEVYADTEYSDTPKYRLRFTYHEHDYDFPITDPVYLNELSCGIRKTGLKGRLFVSCSLGLEHEGWHFKLAANVFEVEESLQVAEPAPDSWFDEYDRDLARLLSMKSEIEEQINVLRSKLLIQMEKYGVEKVNSQQFSVSYTPPKTVMQFDSRAFRKENEELYSNYCKPKQREASIIVKRNKTE